MLFTPNEPWTLFSNIVIKIWRSISTPATEISTRTLSSHSSGNYCKAYPIVTIIVYFIEISNHRIYCSQRFAGWILADRNVSPSFPFRAESWNSRISVWHELTVFQWSVTHLKLWHFGTVHRMCSSALRFTPLRSIFVCLWLNFCFRDDSITHWRVGWLYICWIG